MATNNLTTEGKKRRGGTFCAAFGCSNNSGFTGGLFSFPKDQNRRRQWVLQVQKTRRDFVDTNARWLALCGAHFTPDQFDPSVERQLAMGFRSRKLGRRLVPTAIPTEFGKTGLYTARNRKKAAIDKREHYNTIQDLVQNQSTSSPHATAQTTTVASNSLNHESFASSESESEPPANMEDLVEVKLEVYEGLTYSDGTTKPAMQDFGCQFSGTTTQDFCCQFPEDGLPLSEISQTSRNAAASSPKNFDISHIKTECLSDEDKDPQADDEN